MLKQNICNVDVILYIYFRKNNIVLLIVYLQKQDLVHSINQLLNILLSILYTFMNSVGGTRDQIIGS